MTKIVINVCHGGFGLSRIAMDKYCAEKGIDPGEWDKWGFYKDFHSRNIPRDDELLVRIVEELGKAADGIHGKLKVVEVPDDINWYIEEYNGWEKVAERHRSWD
jgi:hypothetical protein